MQEARTVEIDGRRVLGLAEYGDPKGRPVLYFHGGLSSRLDARPADAACRQRAIRLLSVDRPGIGLSDPMPGRRLLDWPKDIERLLDALGIATADVIGWSGGAPHALACAAALPERVRTVVTIGALVPVDKPGRVKEIKLLADRILFPLSRRAPLLAACVMQAIRLGGRHLLLRSLLRSLPSAADRALVSSGSLADATDFFFEAMRQGASGIVADYVVMGAPWGFDPADVSRPVHVVQGAEDDMLPRHRGIELAEALPNGTFHLLAGAGHYAFHRRPAAVLAFLD